MAAFQETTARRKGTYSDGTGDATERLLPTAGGGIEMTSVSIDPVGSSVARRRARVLERLESMESGNSGILDKKQLVSALPESSDRACFQAHPANCTCHGQDRKFASYLCAATSMVGLLFQAAPVQLFVLPTD